MQRKKSFREFLREISLVVCLINTRQWPVFHSSKCKIGEREPRDERNAALIDQEITSKNTKQKNLTESGHDSLLLLDMLKRE